MASSTTVKVEPLVIFPPLNLAIDIQSEEDIDRLESICRSEPTNPLAEKILNALHDYYVHQCRANETFRAWLAYKKPILHRKVAETYHLEGVPKNGEKNR